MKTKTYFGIMGASMATIEEHTDRTATLTIDAYSSRISRKYESAAAAEKALSRFCDGVYTEA